MLAYVPLPNHSGVVNNYVLSNSRKSPATKWFYRVDQNFGTKNRLFFRHGLEDDNPADAPWPTPKGGIAFPGTGINAEGAANSTRNQNAILSDTATFRPNLIGEFRISINRQRTSWLHPARDLIRPH